MFVTRNKEGILGGGKCKQIIIIGVHRPERRSGWIGAENRLAGKPVDKLFGVV